MSTQGIAHETPAHQTPTHETPAVAVTRAGRCSGRVVVVTGAGRGQGAAAARALAAEGGTVVAVDLSDAPAESIGDARYRRLDIGDPSGWARLRDDLRSEHSQIHGLVNNAGITWRARLLDLELTDLHRVLDVNLGGALLGIQHLAPLMGPGSSIVNIGSVAGVTAHFPVAYTVSKWALRGLSRVAALELGERGIRVNMVIPGYIETPMTASASPAFRGANIAETPLARTGTVDEVAPLIVYLISTESSFVTGAEIAVDGGLTVHGGVKSISDAMRIVR